MFSSGRIVYRVGAGVALRGILLAAMLIPGSLLAQFGSGFRFEGGPVFAPQVEEPHVVLRGNQAGYNGWVLSPGNTWQVAELWYGREGARECDLVLAPNGVSSVKDGLVNPRAISIPGALFGEAFIFQVRVYDRSQAQNWAIASQAGSQVLHGSSSLFSASLSVFQTVSLAGLWESFNVHIDGARSIGSEWLSVSRIDDASSGFITRMLQMPVQRFPGDGNRLMNAELHLAEGYRDPETGLPYPNLIPPDAAIQNYPEGRNFFATDTVNWDRLGGDFGNFVPSARIPGPPVGGEWPDHTASEIRGIVFLPRGKHIWGVNSDDGFRLSLGRGKGDVYGLVLAEFDGGRGPSDSIFEFIIEKAGFYFLRCDWWNTFGNSSVELFSVDACTGEKILFNQRADTRAVRVYSRGDGPAFCRGIAPVLNQTEVGVMTPIVITLVDDATTVDPGKVTVTLFQQSVPVRAAKSGIVTTVIVDPPAGGYRPNSSVVGEFSFNGRSYPIAFQTTQLPTGTFFIEAEDFDHGGGLSNPKAGVTGQDVNRMPYYGGAYQGLSAVHDKDYHRNVIVNDGDVYRTGEQPNSPMIAHGGFNSHFRGSYFASVNYRLGWVGEGDSWDYRRAIPLGKYHVYAGLSHGATGAGLVSGVLSRWVFRPQVGFEVFEAWGSFSGPGTGDWDLNTVVPLLDSLGNQAIVEISQAVTDLRYIGLSGDVDFVAFVPTDNRVPSISPIPDQTTLEDRPTGTISISIGDLDEGPSGLSLSAVSSNPGLVPQSGFVFGGSGGSRTLRITPSPNASGSLLITVWVADRFGARAPASFILNITPVDDPPSLATIAGTSTQEDTPFQDIQLAASDPDTSRESFKWTGKAADTGLIPDNQISFVFNDGVWFLKMVPGSNRVGNTLVTVTLSDGTTAVQRAFTATVLNINDPPTISQIPNQTVEEGALTPVIPFVVGDIDHPATALTVTAASDNPAFIPPASLILGGSGSNRTLQVRAPSSGVGSYGIVVRVSDGSLSNQVRFTLFVEPRPRFDYGDAPDTYRTTKARNGPVHRIVRNLQLGLLVDDESDGQPDSAARGDDLNAPPDSNGGDDEDGVAFSTNPIQGLLAGVAVQAPKFGFLDAWADFNGDGDFDDKDERILTRIPMQGGVTNLSYQVPLTAKVGATYSRFRLTSQGIDSPSGAAPDGEVEDHALSIYPLLFDFGDAPETGTSYPTTIARGGAAHLIPPAPTGLGTIHTHAVTIPPRLMLGQWIDDEPDGLPSARADGDDNQSAVLDDEDGVRFVSPMHPGSNAVVEVTLSTPGFLNGWVDFGRDGGWTQQGDMLWGEGLSLTGGVHRLSFFVPANAVPGSTFARFRVSNLRQLILKPDGFGGLGEVEDYEVRVDRAPRCQNTCEGRLFVLAFPGNYTPDPANPPRLQLCIEGRPEARGFVIIPSLRFTNVFNFGADRVRVIDLPSAVELGNLNDAVADKGVFVFATQDVSIHAINTATNTSDGFLALPVDVLGTEYLVQGYANVHPGRPRLNGSQFAIVGTVSNTLVTIVPSVRVGGRDAGVPYTITLNTGDVYQLRNTNDVPGDLSGTHISSTEPIGVYGGHRCANINTSTTFFCDYVVEQLLPIRDFGTEFYTWPLAGRLGGDTFRVMASADSTRVRINGTQVAVLNRGQNHQQVIAGGAVITADKPVSVTQYANSSDFDGVENADPFMVNVIPSPRYTFQHRICTGPPRFRDHWLNIVVPETARGIARIDGVPIPFAEFQRIGTSSFYGVSKRVSQGFHVVDAPAFEGPGGSPISVIAYGWSQYDSYGWP
ncbi:MAG: hypothetical protein FJ405_06505, partial [Verrucomicrobia bacterium]|nr:hypothetical protein [Verrucomicrobiota bacterium]